MPPRTTHSSSEIMDVLRTSGQGVSSSTTNHVSSKEEDHQDGGGSLSEITSPAALRDLVLGYLVHHSYMETALAFAGASEGSTSTTHLDQGAAAHSMIRGESGAEMELELSDMLAVNGNGTSTGSTTSKGKAVAVEHKEVGKLSAKDIQEIRVRKEIRHHILAGRIYAAIELCDVHFPTVLTTSDLPSQSASSRGINGSSSHSGDKSRASLPSYASSLDGAHLALNLQIQAFIEAVRGASKCATSTSGSTGQVTQTAAANAAAAAGVSPAALRAASPSTFSDSGTSSTPSLPAGPGAASGAPGIFESLELVQGINARVQKLPEYWRAMYLKELEGVTALLAYEDLERSPVRRYLDQSRRSALAEQVNSAILLRTGHPSQPLLESAVRQTTFVWTRIATDRVPVPANHPVLAAASSASGPATSHGVVDDAHVTSDDPRKNRGRYLPPWELHTFLAER